MVGTVSTVMPLAPHRSFTGPVTCSIRILGNQDSCGLIPGNGLLGLLHTDNNRRTVLYVCEKHLTPPKDILPLCDTVVL